MRNWGELVITSILLWLYLESICLLIFNSFYFTLPWFIWGAVVVFILLKYAIRIPPPDDEKVKKVFGIDPRDIETQVDGIIDEESEKLRDDEFCLRVIAHRGAGYDYPENSMSAFRNVSFHF